MTATADEFAPNLRPRYRCAEIRNVLTPAALEFGALVLRQLKGLFSLRVAEALPQSNRQFCPITGWQSEEFPKGT